MKKVLCLILALVAVPAMAVQFTLTDAGSGKLTVGYTVAAGEVVRGMALKVSVLSGDAKIAGPTALNLGTCPFNVFMDYAYDVNETYAIGQGNAIAKADSVGPMSSFATYAPFSISMGYLDQDADQTLGEGITTSGSFDITFALTQNSTVKVEADTLRGGAVVGDALVADNLPLQQGLGVVVAETITGTPVVAKTTATPAVADKVNGGRVETFVASGVASSLSHALQYQFDFGDGSALTWGAATQTHTYTYAAAGTYNVTVKARCAADTAIESAVSAPVALAREAVKSSATFYVTWANFGRPNCWAFQRSCRGDINGGKSGVGTNVVWVNSDDLAIFVGAYNVKETPLKTTVVNTIPGICGDNNRGKSGVGTNIVWVNSDDLGIFVANYNAKVAAVLVCDQTNYHFWTN